MSDYSVRYFCLSNPAKRTVLVEAPDRASATARVQREFPDDVTILSVEPIYLRKEEPRAEGQGPAHARAAEGPVGPAGFPA